MLGFAMFGSIIYVPLYLQIVKGASPTESGLLMLPMMAGIIISSVVSGRAMSKIGRYKWFPVAGTATMAAGLLLFLNLEVETPLWQAFTYMAVIGVGLGLAMQALILAAQSALDPRDMGAGTSTATFSRSLGGALGVAVLGALMTNRLAAEIPGFGSRGGGKGPSINEPAAIQVLPPQVRELIQHGFVNALHPLFLVAAAGALVALALALFVPDRELRGGPAAPSAIDEEDAARLAEARAEAGSTV
jgi:MFS family permease